MISRTVLAKLSKISTVLSDVEFILAVSLSQSCGVLVTEETKFRSRLYQYLHGDSVEQRCEPRNMGRCEDRVQKFPLFLVLVP